MLVITRFPLVTNGWEHHLFFIILQILRVLTFFSSFNEIIVLSFSGLSPVQLKSPDAIGVGKSTTLHCWYYLDSPGELIYSVSWYWTPPSDLDFQRWDKSRLMRSREFPNKTVQFFRYRNIDPDGERRKAWDHQLQGIFNINVGFFLNFYTLYV